MPVLAALLISAAGCQNSCSQSAAGTRGPRRGGLQGPPCPRRVRSAWRGACGSAGVLGLGDGSVNTPSGLLRETCLRRRPGPVAGLPAAEPGVRYLMSRITALAVRDCLDLVFPFDEQRDDQGQVTGVRGLAAFPPCSAVNVRNPEWRRRGCCPAWSPLRWGGMSVWPRTCYARTGEACEALQRFTPVGRQAVVRVVPCPAW